MSGLQHQRVDVDALRTAVALSDVVGRRVKLKRAGRELVGLCPFHDERSASFGVNDDKGRYHCFGCGASGDVLDFVQAAEGLAFLDAAKWLGAEVWPAVDRAARELAVKADSVERLAKIADAKAIWAAAIPAPSTPAEFYLRSRGVTVAIPRSIRFMQTWAWKDYETGDIGPTIPALVGAVQAADGAVTGIQRIFLRADGQGKADMPAPKRSLGHLVGGALRLGPPARELLICEGPEDALSLAQELPEHSVWCALGTGLWPQMVLPDIVETVTLCGDNNDAGRAAVEAASVAFASAGRTVRTMFPSPAFVDFNDQLRGIAR